MPARRKKQPPAVFVAPLTDAERFAAAVRATEAKKQADAAAKVAAKQAELARVAELKRLAAVAAQHEADLKIARTEKEQAVERLKEARRLGRGVPEAEATWRDATAALVELETGQRASWDRRPLPQPEHADEATNQAEEDVEASDDNETSEVLESTHA